jgi:hypothetical protein
VLVVGADPFSMHMLDVIPWRRQIKFGALLGLENVRPTHDEPADFDALIEVAASRISADDAPVDAVVGWWDFPTTGLVPVLRSLLGLPGPSPRSVAMLEHKYWSRLVQRSVVPEAVPRFTVVDPFDPAPERLDVTFPAWIKPIKSHSSYLGFRIDDLDQLRGVLPVIRERIARMGRPFDQFLAHVERPPEVEPVGGHHCIVEELISTGQQCTVEGYVHRGQVVVYGTVDSIRARDHPSCFCSYRYPSTIPGEVRARMADTITKVLHAAGYDDAPFNAEFYWDEAADTVRLLEVNCRISKSHCPLFWMVDGASHQQVLVQLALGEQPTPLDREGRYRIAAKYMLRAFSDGIVRHMPDAAELSRFHRRFPDGMFKPLAPAGQRLRHLHYQDSYSFELAELYLGAGSASELEESADLARGLLPIVCTPEEEAA